MTDPSSHHANNPMSIALEAMKKGFDREAGFKPFGATVVKDGTVISSGINSCLRDNDPTAHAEVSAIRAAAKALKTTDLKGCTLYASAQPCPMCRAAAFHAGIETIYYASSWSDYQDLFPDQACHEALSRDPDPAAHLSTAHHAETQDLWSAYRKIHLQQTDNPNS